MTTPTLLIAPHIVDHLNSTFPVTLNENETLLAQQWGSDRGERCVVMLVCNTDAPEGGIEWDVEIEFPHDAHRGWFEHYSTECEARARFAELTA